MIDPAAAACSLHQLLRSADTTGGKPVLLVGREIDRQAVLDELATALETTTVSLGAELSQALISAGSRVDVAAQIASLAAIERPILLSRIEVLFLPQLRIDVIDTLTRLARRRPLCVSWPGRLEHGRLRYADYNHPECLDVDASRAIIHDLSINEGVD